jgi:MATE family multidrug resistance protein
VIRTGASLLLVVAVFQLFDGLQVVATGALRGAGNTHTPMLTNLLGYWLIGIPLGSFLAFKLHWGPAGVWTGLCVALIIIGCVLVTVWSRLMKRLAQELSQQVQSQAGSND